MIICFVCIGILLWIAVWRAAQPIDADGDMKDKQDAMVECIDPLIFIHDYRRATRAKISLKDFSKCGSISKDGTFVECDPKACAIAEHAHSDGGVSLVAPWELKEWNPNRYVYDRAYQNDIANRTGSDETVFPCYECGVSLIEKEVNEQRAKSIVRMKHTGC